MADICRGMADDEDSNAKCREARRRRIETRRFITVSGNIGSPASSSGEKRRDEREHRCGDKRHRRTPSSSSSSSLSGGRGRDADVPSTSGMATPVETPQRFGSISLSGRSREMEDAFTVKPCFFWTSDSGGSPYHFFAVYDGHGGSHISALCRERMHVYLAEELRKVLDSGKGGAPSRGGAPMLNDEQWRAAMGRCFRRVDEVALKSCACGSVVACVCERASVDSEIVGSTAVAVVLCRDRIVVANCGDSRAVLSRGGRALPLSSDHKPDRPDELARIEAAGGRVIYLNGARVLGILAMSRALGDKYLKPIVISDPEVTITERTHEDECLIIASDGLWDVLSNDLACDIARRCLEEGNPQIDRENQNREGGNDEQQAPDVRCTLAAALLTRLALGRKSLDNISVIVVDLRRRVSSGGDVQGLQ